MIGCFRLSTGRVLRTECTQILAVDGRAGPVMLAFVGPNGSIVAGHAKEEAWYQFLMDAGMAGIRPHGSPGLRAELITSKGIHGVPSTQIVAYSDAGDPVAAAVSLDGPRPGLGHCGEPGWEKFCKHNGIHVPRRVHVIDQAAGG